MDNLTLIKPNSLPCESIPIPTMHFWRPTSHFQWSFFSCQNLNHCSHRNILATSLIPTSYCRVWEGRERNRNPLDLPFYSSSYAQVAQLCQNISQFHHFIHTVLSIWHFPLLLLANSYLSFRSLPTYAFPGDLVWPLDYTGFSFKCTYWTLYLLFHIPHYALL